MRITKKQGFALALTLGYRQNSGASMNLLLQFHGKGVQICKMKLSEMAGSGGGPTIQIYLMPLHCTLKGS